jgi:protein-disulfide isomerase
VTVTELSETLGISAKELEACSNSTAAREAIDRDIADGLSLQIGGTPTFVVGGVTYAGRLPQEVIDQALAGL